MGDIPLITYDPPFVLSDCASPGPLVFASPHSGRVYPEALLRQTRLPREALRKGEDRFVDRLIAGVGGQGSPILAATVARAYIDLNRAPDELDPDLILDLPPYARVTPRVGAGLGIIPRTLAPGESIYAGKLSLAEALERIAAVHTPWHVELDRLLARARRRHGFALLIDCHSMPSVPGAPRAVVGDLHGRSANAAIGASVEMELRAVGLSVARNTPYAGAYTLERHGRPEAGVHAVQIEFDRSLYLDAASATLVPSAARLTAQIARFSAALTARLGAASLAIAAE